MNIKAPIQSLEIILQRIVASESKISEFTRLLTLPNSQPRITTYDLPEVGIPLKRLRSKTQICYISALPQVLAHDHPKQITPITGYLLEKLHSYQANFSSTSEYLSLPKAIVCGIVATSTNSGTIQFELQDTAIAFWLNELLQLDCTGELGQNLGQNSGALPTDTQRVFRIQHAHARCCSLLRHAKAEQLINFPPGEANNRMPTNPISINWLTLDRRLQLTHATERQLINHLLGTLDIWVNPVPDRTKHLFLAAEAIGVTFHAVHRAAQPFGDLKREPRDRLHAHLGLMSITQKVLFHLLSSLQVVAPFEL